MDHHKHSHEKESSLTTKNEAKDFVTNSTAHGLKAIFEKDRSVIRRLLWAVLFLASVGTMGYMVYEAYKDICGYPFNTVFSMTCSVPITFPAVTICNLNPIDLTTLPPGKDKLMDDFFSDEEFEPGNFTERMKFDDANMTSLLTKTSPDLHGDHAVSRDGFLTHCQYGGKSLSCGDIFAANYQMEKKCYQLQTDNIAKASRRTLLKLTINVNVAGYLSQVESSGIMFHIHEPGITPDMTMTRYEAPPASPQLWAFYSYLPEPYQAFGESSCTDTESEEFREEMLKFPSLYPTGSTQNGSYSFECCLNTRASLKAAEICNCSMGHENSSYPACDLSQITECLKETTGAILDEAVTSDFLGCPRPCRGKTYAVTTSTSYFPSAQALSYLKRSKGVRAGNITEIRANFLQLQVYLEDLIIRKTEHVAKYEWTSIMGLLGGNMGFFLGASVLTLAELLDFIVCLALLCCDKLCQRRVTARSRSSSVQELKSLPPSKEAW